MKKHKRVRKPAKFETSKTTAYCHNDEWGKDIFIQTECMYLAEAKKLHAWLSHAIKYLEFKEHK